ncbi:MAG: DegT/DnrJ/EryC1/StrS family aminotransferase [Planctomycetota bacterium]
MPVREFGEIEMGLLKEVLDSGQLSSLSGGKMTPRFEREFAAILGAKHGVAMNSAMSVLHACVKAAGAGAGDEVLCESFCVFATVAVLYNNAIPVHVDIKRDTFNMDPDKIEAKISDRTKALIVTHVFGLPAEMDRIVEIAHRRGLIVIEDCAHSILAKYKGRCTGTWGDIGSFSFQMSKQLGLGDGGMAVTSDEKLRDALALNAGAPTFHSVAHDLYYNYRMNEMTAAVGVGQLQRIHGYVKGLQENARLYDAAVEDCPWITIQRGPAEAEHTYHIWGARFHGQDAGVSRDRFAEALKQAGCSLGIGYTKMAAYQHPMIQKRLGYGRGCPLDCPLYEGDLNRYPAGTCPVVEEVMPNVLMASPFGPRGRHEKNAAALRKAWEACAS